MTRFAARHLFEANCQRSRFEKKRKSFHPLKNWSFPSLHYRAELSLNWSERVVTNRRIIARSSSVIETSLGIPVLRSFSLCISFLFWVSRSRFWHRSVSYIAHRSIHANMRDLHLFSLLRWWFPRWSIAEMQTISTVMTIGRTSDFDKHILQIGRPRNEFLLESSDLL